MIGLRKIQKFLR